MSLLSVVALVPAVTLSELVVPDEITLATFEDPKQELVCGLGRGVGWGGGLDGTQQRWLGLWLRMTDPPPLPPSAPHVQEQAASEVKKCADVFKVTVTTNLALTLHPQPQPHPQPLQGLLP